MMVGYEPYFCRDTCWKKRDKRYSLAIEKMRDGPIDVGQKLKKEGDENRNLLCWLERKKGSWEISPHFLVVKDTFMENVLGTNNGSMRYQNIYIYI